MYNLETTFHAQQEQKHLFSQFALPVQQYPEMILEVESCMSLEHPNSSSVLSKSGLRNKNKAGLIEKFQHQKKKMRLLQVYSSIHRE